MRKMNRNAWTLGLIGVGLVSLPAVMHAEEKTNAVLSALSATTISGYVDTSAQWNIGTGNDLTPAYAFSSGKADGFNLNVVKLQLEKPLEATDSWAAGFKVDTFMGPDANLLASQSLGTRGDFAVKQAYVALRAPVGNGLDFKVGVFDTIIGYEVTDAPLNPNFTRSYGYSIEPSTHTGALVSYQFNDVLSASAGIANTFGPAINERAFPDKAESFKSYLGCVILTAPQSWGFLAGSTLTGCVISGYNSGILVDNSDPTAPDFGADETSWYVGGTLNTPVTGLKVGASYDYLAVHNQPLTQATFGSAYANATAIYASYQLTEKMTIYGRGEYASTDLPAGYITQTTGTRGVFATTATVQYDLWANVLSRLEFRWDHVSKGDPAYGTVNADGIGSKKDSYILLANIAYKF